MIPQLIDQLRIQPNIQASTVQRNWNGQFNLIEHSHMATESGTSQLNR